jgi:hypothetical protein
VPVRLSKDCRALFPDLQARVATFCRVGEKRRQTQDDGCKTRPNGQWLQVIFSLASTSRVSTAVIYLPTEIASPTIIDINFCLRPALLTSCGWESVFALRIVDSVTPGVRHVEAGMDCLDSDRWSESCWVPRLACERSFSHGW